MITDGETHEPGATDAAAAAKKKGINVFILGIGNTTGAPIPMGDGGYLKDHSGNTVMTALNENMCKELAQLVADSIFMLIIPAMQRKH